MADLNLTTRSFKLPDDVYDKGAVFDGENDIYRYKLWRKWDDTKPALLFVMMNPSCANIDYDDATVAKCQRFARLWGYGSLLVGNTFAYRATYQEDLIAAEDPVGPGNFKAILEMAKRPGTKTIMAYGKPKSKKLLETGPALCRYLAENGVELYALKVLKDGTPGHPLYISQKTVPVKLDIK